MPGFTVAGSDDGAEVNVSGAIESSTEFVHRFARYRTVADGAGGRAGGVMSVKG